METKQTPDEWLKDERYKGLVILDPDGWDRKNFEKDWNTPITERDFRLKVIASTTRFPIGFDLW